MCRWKMTEDKKFTRHEDEKSQVQWHKKAENGKKIYISSDDTYEQESHVKGVLVTYLKKGKIKRTCDLNFDEISNDEGNDELEHPENFLEDIIENIKSEEVFACVDASVKDTYMGAHYCVVNDDNTVKIDKSMCTDQWKNNAAYSAEA